MEHIDFFKLQAKNFLKDFKTKEKDNEGIYYYKPKFFMDIEEIIGDYDINEHEPFSLMNAQHIIALLSGFNSWSDLIHSNEFKLKLGKHLFESRTEFFEGFPLIIRWQDYEKQLSKDMDDQAKLGIFEYIFLGIQE